MSDNAEKRLRPVHWLACLAVAISAVICAGLIIWWGAIRESLMDPAVPYQTYLPSPAPDYGDPKAWAMRPGADSSAADVFFIHPTTYNARHWNAPFDHAKADRLLRQTMIPNYAGPFAKAGRVFAPHYRQASLYTLMTLREDAREARAFAYGDVKAAFDAYLAQDNQGRPFILVGVEQGAVLADRLARETIAADPALTRRLAAVYLIEAPIEAAGYPAGAIAPCTARDQAGCVAAWVGEAYNEQRQIKERLRHAPVWRDGALVHLAGRPTLCFNPVLGSTSAAPATAKNNLGAANATGLEWGVRPGFQMHQVSAQCVGGVLKISKPRSPSLRRGSSWLERQRVRPHNVFYADIEADALARVAALAKAHPVAPAKQEP